MAFQAKAWKYGRYIHIILPIDLIQKEIKRGFQPSREKVELVKQVCSACQEYRRKGMSYCALCGAKL